MSFTTAQLRAIRVLTVARIEAGGTDPRWAGLLAEADAQLAVAPTRELVFRLELPLEPVDVGRPGKPSMVKLAMTLNEYSCAKGWAKAKARTEVDRRIVVARHAWPNAHCGIQKRAKIVGGEPVIVPVAGTGRRRLVRVVRRSSRRLDEVTCDVLGGKIGVDRLVQAEILAGDSAKWLLREAAWEPCDPGDGLVIVEVFELEKAVDPPEATRRKRYITR